MDDTVSLERGIFLVIGGSRGIGAAIAIAAGRSGYPVVLTYAGGEEQARRVVADIEAASGRATALQFDAAGGTDPAVLFEAVDRLGRLDVMTYNSGITGPHSVLADATAETIDTVLDVNLRGAILCSAQAVRRMSTWRGGEGGAIVLVSSRAAAYGSAGEFVWYAASKGGLDSLTIGLAREVGPEGIRVNAVSPGPIDTEMHRPGRLEAGAAKAPLGRAGRAEEVADAVMFLASKRASYITGAILPVSGGL